MFEYKLLPVPSPSKKARGRKTVSDRFTHAMEQSLNEQAVDGWMFSGQETFQLGEKTGLMGKEKQIEFRTLIFRREVKQDPASLDAMPLDQKLADMKNRRIHKPVQPVQAPEPVVAPVAVTVVPTFTPPEEPTIVVPPEPAHEPFPEPMPAYVPEQPKSEPVAKDSKVDTAHSLPFPGPAPAQTIGMTGQDPALKLDAGPTLNYDHSKGDTGASIDAPILGPAKRD